MLLRKRIPLTYIIKKIRIQLVYVLSVCVLIILVKARYQHLLPDMPLTIPAFIGTAISILLSFRLSQSYDRWWEARKNWGSIVNDSRSFVIQLKTLVANGNEALVNKIALRQAAWCYSLGQSLRGLDATANIEHLITHEDMVEIKQHSNKPFVLLYLHGKDLKELKDNGQLELFSQLQLDSTIVRLCDAQGRCERIKNTVFPATYSLFLHAMIYLFVITLSISLQDVGGMFEIPLLLLISSAFFLLEKTATYMQDPFDNTPTDTAVTAIARTIEINIKQLIKDSNVPSPLQPESFYLC